LQSCAQAHRDEKIVARLKNFMNESCFCRRRRQQSAKSVWPDLKKVFGAPTLVRKLSVLIF
jgi:hypothetical protein